MRIYEYFNTAEGKIGPFKSGSDAPPLLKRKRVNGVVKNHTPANFKTALQKAKTFCEEYDMPMVTVNSWNEWTETSYLAPDDVYGYGYLDAVRDVFLEE